MGAVELDLKISGKEGAPVLFFVHGWPDSADLWETQINYFSKTYRCVAVTMPLFHQENSTAGALYSCFGYNFDVMTELLATAVKKVSPGKPVILVQHDWGSFWGFHLQSAHPELVSSIINFDVGLMAFKGFRGAKAMIMFGIAYQYVFILAWLIHLIPIIGNSIAVQIIKFFLNPGVAQSKKQGQYFPDPRTCHPRMMYPYFYFHWNFWLNFLSFGILGVKVPYQTTDAMSAPKCPLLFMYGEKKAYMFHKQKWADSLSKRGDGSNSIGFPTGHWVMLDSPGPVTKEMEKFLSEQVPQQ